MTITYGSVCSGIEAASIAWEPLGMKPSWFSQFDPEHNYNRGPDFPSAVLAHHWPEIINLGDMTKIASKVMSGEVDAPDILVGGTPCQSFSIGGLRKGLDDARGQLTFSYVEIANCIDNKRMASGRPASIVVWENVPGVLNTKGNAFGNFIGALVGEDLAIEPPGGKWSNAGYVSGPNRNLAWIVKDAQYYGVAQRRRRVFIVASARKDMCPGKILFESEGVQRPVRPTRKTPLPVCLTARGAGSLDDRETYVATECGRVRHLMPIENERQMGFPDGHTNIGADGPRYKAIGNSMAVPVMKWIGERIMAQLVAGEPKKTAGDYGGSSTPPEIRDLWQTPKALYDYLHAEFNFSVDLAASALNKLHENYITEDMNALKINWCGMYGVAWGWMNPPYSNIGPFIEKAIEQQEKGFGTVMLVPSDTSVGWFDLALRSVSEVRFITGGRLSFIRADTGKAVNGNNKGSMLLIFSPHKIGARQFGTVDRDTLMAPL